MSRLLLARGTGHPTCLRRSRAARRLRVQHAPQHRSCCRTASSTSRTRLRRRRWCRDGRRPLARRSSSTEVRRARWRWHSQQPCRQMWLRTALGFGRHPHAVALPVEVVAAIFAARPDEPLLARLVGVGDPNATAWILIWRHKSGNTSNSRLPHSLPQPQASAFGDCSHIW